MVRHTPSEISARPLQNRRGMVPSAQGRNAISWTFSMLWMLRSEFQNRPCVVEKRCRMVSIAQVLSQAGSCESNLGPQR